MRGTLEVEYKGRNMLQELLNLGLVDIGSDDSRFAKMESAATKLSKQFEESPSLMVTATLVAMDDNIAEEDPFLELVEGLVIEEWKTLRNTHVNRPRELLRSIAISALFAAATAHPERSAIVWNTAASRLIHAQTSLGKAAGLLEAAVRTAFAVSEREALKRAGMTAVPMKNVRRNKSTSLAHESSSLTGSIESNDVLQDVARAAGPQLSNGQALKSPNPHWSNQGQAWSNEFTPRMTDALVSAVNLGTTRLANSIASELEARMRAMAEHLQQEMGKQAESLQSKLAESEAAGRTRLDVLWWSQARYSPSQNNSYSSLSAAAAAVAAVADLAAIVPAVAPASVTHVLGETMAACSGNQRRRLLDYFEMLKESTPVALGKTLARADSYVGRVPLLQLVASVVAGNTVSADDLRLRAGVDPDLALEPAELAMWVFRELQARRIAEGAE